MGPLASSDPKKSCTDKKQVAFFSEMTTLTCLTFLTSAKIVSPKVKCGRHVKNTKFSLDPKQPFLFSVPKSLFILRTTRVRGAQVCEPFRQILPFVWQNV